jgi:flagellar motor component MotA
VLQKLDDQARWAIHRRGLPGYPVGHPFGQLIWLPLAGKLRAKSEEEIRLPPPADGGRSGPAGRREPRIVKEKLNAFLPPRSARAKKALARNRQAGQKARAGA